MTATNTGATDCPFELDVTLPAFNYNYLVEVSPYRTLTEVVAFYKYLKNGQTTPWLDNVAELKPSTDFCYLNNQSSSDDEGWFPKPRIDRNSLPKNLLCHDYRGGYLEDRFLNGSNQHESYNFINWDCIDIFVYFSHNFVTVPPPMWINAAHINGVPILGTLITEPKDGNSIWNQILATEEKATWFAEALALIAETHKFDGYLLNIENPLSLDLMPKLMLFIKSLKQKLAENKKFKTYVIWYDSLTVYGELKWQNELNYKNKPFFDITDGIFLNYTWKEQNLETSKKMAAERIHDVYVGVDVFGRNMLGGGGYNTKEALQIVHSKNLSSAIFAFGWTHEKIPGNFHINDDIFWRSIFPYLYSHGTKQFPFKCNFSRGCGLKFYVDGVVKGERPWFDLSQQSYQHSHLKFKTAQSNEEPIKSITSIITEYVRVLNQKRPPEEESLKLETLGNLASELFKTYGRMKESLIEYTFSDAFNGGGCIKIRPSYEEGMKHVPLFDFDITVSSDWVVKTVMKSENERHVSDVEIYPIVYVIVQSVEGSLIKIELRHAEIESFKGGWAVRKFMFNQKGRIIEMGLLINPTHRPVLLGEITISQRSLE